MLLIKMNLFITVSKKIKEMINESPLKGVGLLFVLLGALEISFVYICMWMFDRGSESGIHYLFFIIALLNEFGHVRQIGIVKCSIGVLLLIIHMVKKNMHTENNLGRKQ